MAAKLVVTKARGGSKITLVGTSGTELLSSKVFMEPRAKGATLRSLKGLLGEDIVVDDQTITVPVKAASVKPTPATPTPPAKPATSGSGRRSPRKAVTATTARRATAGAAAEANGKATDATDKPARRRTRKAAK